MKRNILILSLGLFLFAFWVYAAPNPFDIKFPISALGNCASIQECKTYCDEPAHLEACIVFGEKNGLMSKEEASEAKKFAKSVKEGDWPLSDCDSHEECGRKCNLPQNRDRCFNWAKKRGFVKEEFRRPNEQEINKDKAAAAILEDGGPGGCGSFEACEQFCSSSANQKTCFEYAEEHDLFPKEELEKMKRFINKPGPGGCRGEQCRTYCDISSHHDECFKFAKENDLISGEELERIEKFKAARENLQSFGGPGNCKGENECHKYCSQPEHSRECIEFAKKAGFLHEDRAEEHFRKLNRYEERFEEFKHEESRQGPPPVFENGPGGCSTPEECVKFCSEPKHRDECAKFGPKAGGPPPGGTFREGRPPHPEQSNMPPSPHPSYSPYPVPDEFYDPAAKCSEHGGRWNGSFCEFPQPSPTPQLNSLLQSFVRFLHN